MTIPDTLRDKVLDALCEVYDPRCYRDETGPRGRTAQGRIGQAVAQLDPATRARWQELDKAIRGAGGSLRMCLYLAGLENSVGGPCPSCARRWTPRRMGPPWPGWRWPGRRLPPETGRPQGRATWRSRSPRTRSAAEPSHPHAAGSARGCPAHGQRLFPLYVLRWRRKWSRSSSTSPAPQPRARLSSRRDRAHQRCGRRSQNLRPHAGL